MKIEDLEGRIGVRPFFSEPQIFRDLGMAQIALTMIKSDSVEKYA